jgi:hypothetical protein
VIRVREGLRIKRKARGFGQKCPSSSPDPEQGREAGAASAGGGRRHPGVGGGRGQGGKEEGGEGFLLPCSPWSGMA